MKDGKTASHELLQLKAEQVKNASEILLAKTVDWQVIKEFLSNRLADIELTAIQEEKLKRYNFIYAQLSSGRYTKAQVISQLMSESLYGVSMSQAYEDIRCAGELFAVVAPPKKQFEINLRYEIAKAAHAKCLEIFDFKAAAAYEKVIQGYIEMMPDEEDNPGLDFEGHTIEATFNPELLGGPKINMKEVLKIVNERNGAKINLDMFEHLESEEVKND